MPQLRRDLGAVAATSIVVGTMIGSGIFIGPEGAALAFLDTGTAPTAWGVMAVWAVGGLLVLLGALTYAELATMFPRSGGQVVYVREAFGHVPGFLNAWAIALVTKTGSISVLAAGFARIYGALVGVTGWETHVIAIGLITGLSIINAVGVKYGGQVQVVTTAGKLVALAALVALGLFGGGEPVPQPQLQRELTGGALALMQGGFLGLIAVLWAYDGWYNSTQVAEEVQNPNRNLPLSLILGTVLVMGAYLLTNAAYLNVLGPAGLAGINADPDRPLSSAAAVAASAVASETVARLILVGVLVSIFSACNGVIMTGPRILLFMAQERMLPRKLGEIHPRWATPHWAILAQGVWASIIVLFGTFEQLMAWVITTTWIFLGLAGVALFALRRTRPDAPRPYRVPLYPWVPAAFVLLSAIFILNTLVTRPVELLLGIAVTLTGLPFLWWLRRRDDSAATAPPRG